MERQVLSNLMRIRYLKTMQDLDKVISSSFVSPDDIKHLLHKANNAIRLFNALNKERD